MAKALGMSPTSSGFQMLITASGQFGLTEGSYVAAQISLSDRGRMIVAPRTPEEKERGMRDALFSVDVFRTFLERFDGHKLPETEFVQNTLARDFGVPPESVTDCYDMILANAKELGMLEDISGSTYVRVSKIRAVQAMQPATSQVEEALTPPPESPKSVTPAPPAAAPIRQRVFISHGKNKKILDAVCEILEFGGFEPVVAEREETAAIPVPEKVLESMRRCSCGIMNLSLDATEKREDGSYGVNQNVLIEVGAAFVLYNKRIILLYDKRVTVPSNLQGLYRCEYEGEEMDYKTTMKLLKALNEFKRQG